MPVSLYLSIQSSYFISYRVQRYKKANAETNEKYIDFKFVYAKPLLSSVKIQKNDRSPPRKINEITSPWPTTKDYFLYFCHRMKTIASSLIRCVRFRRWNRHSYSTFCSIGRCVNIGSVRKEIADQSLKKGLSSLKTCGDNQSASVEYDSTLPDESSPEMIAAEQIEVAVCASMHQLSPLPAGFTITLASYPSSTILRNNGPWGCLCRIFYFPCLPFKSLRL